MRASYALPGIFRPVSVDGRWLFDGALVNPIPVSVCRALGARVVIAVNLHSDVFGKGTVIPNQVADLGGNGCAEEENGSDKSNGHSALHLLHRQFFGKGKDRPGISTVMMEAFNIVQDRIARSRLAGDPPDLTITPKLGDVGLFEFHRADELIRLGAEAAAIQLQEIEDSLRVLVS